MIMTFLLAKDGVNLDVPLAVVRLCNHLGSKDVCHESILLQRWSKMYDRKKRTPSFACIPVTQLRRRILVFEDFPELIEARDEWISRSNDPLGRDHLPPPMYEGLPSIKVPLTMPKHSVMPSDALSKDWLYVVTPFETWKDSFTS